MNNNIQNQYLSIGEGIRNVTDHLLINFCQTIKKESLSSTDNKKKEYKKFIKEFFYEYIKKVKNMLKNYEKIDYDEKIKGSLSLFNTFFYQMLNQTRFAFELSNLYTFPGYNPLLAIDLLFNNCNNNLAYKLKQENLLKLNVPKHLYDNNEISFLIDNSFHLENHEDIKNELTKNIKNKIKSKLDKWVLEINDDNFIINFENNSSINMKLFKNLDIKIILVQNLLDPMKYTLLPICINYNNESILMNDTGISSHFKYKYNQSLKYDDLQFYINKLKYLFIEKLTKNDFFDKCLSIREYTSELFEIKFKYLKEKLNKKIKMWDIPIKVSENECNENQNYLKIYFVFDVTIKQQNEFYISFNFDKNFPTNIKLIHSHNIITPNESTQIIYTEYKEEHILFNIENIQVIILEGFYNYRKILMYYIYQKLLNLSSLFFDYEFIFFSHKNPEVILQTNFNSNSVPMKLLSFHLNSSGKLTLTNLYSSQIFYDNSQKLDKIINEYLVNCKDDNIDNMNINSDLDKIDLENKYIYMFNDYIAKIFIEKICSPIGIKIILQDINYEKQHLKIRVYNNFYNDIENQCFFDIQCSLKEIEKNKNYTTIFKIENLNFYLQNKTSKDETCGSMRIDCIKDYKQLCNEIGYTFFEFSISSFNQFFKIIKRISEKNAVINCLATELFGMSTKPNIPLEIGKQFNINEVDFVYSKNINYLEWSTDNLKLEIGKNYKNELKKYFRKVQFSRDNYCLNLFLKKEIFKEKYKNLLFYFMEKYSVFTHEYILGYNFEEDYITILYLSKLNPFCSNNLQKLFELYVPKLILYLESIIKFLDFCAINEPIPILIGCPIFIMVKLIYNPPKFLNNFEPARIFERYLIYKIQLDKEQYFSVEGNMKIFSYHYLKEIASSFFVSEFNKCDKYFIKEKAKTLYLVYQIYEMYSTKFNISTLLSQRFSINDNNIVNNKVFFLVNEFNVLELILLNKFVLRTQITPENDLYLEFRDNSCVINNNYQYLNFFIKKLNEMGIDYKKVDNNSERKNYINILLDEENEEMYNSLLLVRLRKIIEIIEFLAK